MLTELAALLRDEAQPYYVSILARLVSRSRLRLNRYRSMASTTTELTWLFYLLDQIGFSYAKPINLYYDNIEALHLSINIVFYGRTKHIQLDYHFVSEKVAYGLLNTCYLNTSRQVADLFTWPLCRIQFLLFEDKIGVHKSSIANLRGIDKTLHKKEVIYDNRQNIIYDVFNE